MDIKGTIQPLLDNPHAQALIAQATTEEAKQTVITELYEMLPRPVRWVLKQDAFDAYIRQYVFREPPKTAEAPQPEA